MFQEQPLYIYSLFYVYSGVQSALVPIYTLIQHHKRNQNLICRLYSQFAVKNDKKLPTKKLVWEQVTFRTNLVSFKTFKFSLSPKLVSWLELILSFLQQTGSSCQELYTTRFGKCCKSEVPILLQFYARIMSDLKR